MARPKRDSGVPARERIEEAFWSMLAQMPYADITISSLSKRAGVNHNTFYYYFDNLDDMAQRMIEQNLLTEIPMVVMGSFTTGALDMGALLSNEVTKTKFERCCALAGPHSSSWIKDRLRSSIFALWMESIGIDPKKLSQNEQIVLSFALGGLFAVVGEYGQSKAPIEFTAIVESDLGRGLLSTIRTMMANHLPENLREPS